MAKSFLIILLFFCISCNAQSNESNLKKNDGISAKRTPDSTISKPDVNIKVDKKYDDDGNLIGYDSTYSYVYRSFDGDSINLKMDSVFSDFKPFMKDYFNFYGGEPFSDFFERDSLFYHNFFHNDYFQNRFLESREEFESIFRKMDSLENEFYRDKLPESEKESIGKDI